jgi:hypothetical protein
METFQRAGWSYMICNISKGLTRKVQRVLSRIYPTICIKQNEV